MRILALLAIEVFSIGLATLVGFVTGRRAGFFRGVCRGMYCAGKMLGQGAPVSDFDEDYDRQFRRPN